MSHNKERILRYPRREKLSQAKTVYPVYNIRKFYFISAYVAICFAGAQCCLSFKLCIRQYPVRTRNELEAAAGLGSLPSRRSAMLWAWVCRVRRNGMSLAMRHVFGSLAGRGPLALQQRRRRRRRVRRRRQQQQQNSSSSHGSSSSSSSSSSSTTVTQRQLFHWRLLLSQHASRH